MRGIWKRDFPPFDVFRGSDQVVVRGEKVSGSFREWGGGVDRGGPYTADSPTILSLSLSLSLPRFHPRAPPIRHADTSARGRRGEGVTNQASRRAGLERPLPFQGRGWAGGIDGSFLGSRPGVVLYCTPRALQIRMPGATRK